MELSEAELLAIVDDLKIKSADIKLRTDAKLFEMRQLADCGTCLFSFYFRFSFGHVYSSLCSTQLDIFRDFSGYI